MTPTHKTGQTTKGLLDYVSKPKKCRESDLIVKTVTHRFRTFLYIMDIQTLLWIDRVSSLPFTPFVVCLVSLDPFFSYSSFYKPTYPRYLSMNVYNHLTHVVVRVSTCVRVFITLRGTQMWRPPESLRRVHSFFTIPSYSPSDRFVTSSRDQEPFKNRNK